MMLKDIDPRRQRDDSDAKPGHLKPTGVLQGCREDGGRAECTRGLGISWSHCCPHHLSDSSSSSQGHGSPGLGQIPPLFLPACPLADLRCIFTDGILTAVDATCFSTLASSGPACWVQSPVGTSSHLSLCVVVMSLSCAP